MPESAPLTESGFEPPLADARAGKYLLFRLGDGEFGVPIGKVREVMEMLEITQVPNSPAFIAGVINLHGKVIPVVDLRLTFGLPAGTPTTQTCIVAVRLNLASIQQILGIIVDAITEVVHLQGSDFLDAEEYQPVSEHGTREPVPYLLGVARVEGKTMLLLDLDEVLNHLDPRQLPVLQSLPKHA